MHGGIGAFGRVSKPSEPFWRVCKAFDRIFERLREFWVCLGLSFGAFGRVLDTFGRVCRVWESFGALETILGRL